MSTKDNYGQKFMYNDGTRPRKTMQDIAGWYKLGNDTNLDKYRIHKMNQNEKNQYDQTATKSIPSITRNRIPFEKLYKNSTNISGEHLLAGEPEYNNEDRNKIATAPEITKETTETKTETAKEKQYENTIFLDQKQDVNLELQYAKLANNNATNLLELNHSELLKKRRNSNPYGYDTLESTGGEKH